MHMKNFELKNELIAYSKSLGISLIGFADLGQLKGKLTTYPPDLLDPITTGISIALRLDDEIIRQIDSAPTIEYADHYREINIKIDKSLNEIAKWIESHQGHVFIVPASKIMNSKNLAGHISHKAVARLAGLGWIGKSLLLVHPTEGPRIRFGTILTDIQFPFDTPIDNGCGPCPMCTQACPVQAIYDVNTQDYYKSPNDAIDLDRCFTQCKIFRDLPGIRATICGICMRACPYGQK